MMPTLAPRLRLLLLAMALLAFVASAYWAVRQQPDIMHRLDATYVGLLLLIGIPIIWIGNALEFQLMGRYVGVHIRLGPALVTTLLASAANMLPLPGGVLTRMATLKGHGTGLKAGARINLLFALLWVAASLCYSGVWLVIIGPTGIGVAFVCAGAAMALAGGAIARNRGGDVGVLQRALSLRLLMSAGENVALFWAFLAVGLGIPFGKAALFGLSSVLGSAVSIVPAGLGVREGAAALLALLVDVPPANAFLAIAGMRLLLMIFMATMTGVMMGLRGNTDDARKPAPAPDSTPEATPLVVWGTYDLGKPRTRILLRGLREQGMPLHAIHADVWRGVEDKSQVHGGLFKLRLLLRWIGSYPGLIARYLRAPHHDTVLVCYMGFLDVLILWPFARLRGARIVWDVFIPLYNMVVEDRRLFRPGSLPARLVFALEWLASRAADLLIFDTDAHRQYFARAFHLPAVSTGTAWVGVEPERFTPKARETSSGASRLSVLFYGQMIPLHGVQTIIEAARITRDEPIDWTIIGDGQESAQVERMLAEMPLPHLQWVRWVEYPILIDWLAHADVCLGIFGDSDKAGRVIPNKVFQIAAAGRPLITRDSPAIRELLSPEADGVALVPAADAQALAAAVRHVHPLAGAPGHHHAAIAAAITPLAVAGQFLDVLHRHDRHWRQDEAVLHDNRVATPD